MSALLGKQCGRLIITCFKKKYLKGKRMKDLSILRHLLLPRLPRDILIGEE